MIYTIPILLALLFKSSQGTTESFTTTQLPPTTSSGDSVNFIYRLGQPNEDCLTVCRNYGHRSCIANVGTTDQALEALYELQVDNNGLHNGGQHQPYNSQIAMWSESYHPIVDASNQFKGYDVIPRFGGDCAAQPGHPADRRLCSCYDEECIDVFYFCRSLRFICHKYAYTQQSCPVSCKTCVNIDY